MHSVLLAESAVLLCFHTIGMSFLILGHIVVSLLALGACKCDLCTHGHTSIIYIDFPTPGLLSVQKRRVKKKRPLKSR